MSILEAVYRGEKENCRNGKFYYSSMTLPHLLSNQVDLQATQLLIIIDTHLELSYTCTSRNHVFIN